MVESSEQYTKDLLPPPAYFESERLRYRRVTREDVCTRYLSWLNDPIVNQYLETRWSTQNLETIDAFVSSMLGNPKSYLLAVIDKALDLHIGNYKLGPINPIHRFADVSGFIGEREYWSRGYGTEVLKAVMGFGFGPLSLHTIQAGVYGSNAQSIRHAEKGGLLHVGTIKKQLRNGDAWEDHHILSATNPNERDSI